MTAHTATIQTTDAGLLRFALRLDAAITAANAIAYLALFWLLDGAFGVPGPFLAGVGAIFTVSCLVTTGLDKPELTVTLKFDEGRKEDRVAFGRSGAEGLAARAGEPGAAKIPASTVDAIVKALEDLK